MGLYAKAFVVGLIVSGIIGVMVWVTGAVKDSSGGFPSWYLPLLLVVECAYKVNCIKDNVYQRVNDSVLIFSTDLHSNDHRFNHGIQCENQ